jgi:hypothetical protein
MLKYVNYKKCVIMPGEEKHLKYIPMIGTLHATYVLECNYIDGTIYFGKWTAANHYGIPLDNPNNETAHVYVSYQYDDGE